jgi:hypothetical protein
MRKIIHNALFAALPIMEVWHVIDSHRESRMKRVALRGSEDNRMLFDMVAAMGQVPASWGVLWENELGNDLLARIGSLNADLTPGGLMTMATYTEIRKMLVTADRSASRHSATAARVFVLLCAARVNRIELDTAVAVELLEDHSVADVAKMLAGGVSPSRVPDFVANDIDPELSGPLFQLRSTS